MTIYKLLYFSISGLIFLVACAPHFGKFRTGKSLFSMLVKMWKEGIPGSRLMMITFINLMISSISFIF